MTTPPRKTFARFKSIALPLLALGYAAGLLTWAFHVESEWLGFLMGVCAGNLGYRAARLAWLEWRDAR